MKVSIAVVKLVLRTNKVLSDGSSPIMLRCSFGGMKEKSSGYSCSVRFWDKKNECIKKGFPNYASINVELQRLKNDAINRRNEFIRIGSVYTPSMVLGIGSNDSSSVVKRDIVSNNVSNLIERYLSEKGLSYKTVERWNIVKRSLIEYGGKDLIIDEVNESFCRKYSKWLEGKGLVSGSVRTYMSKVVALLHYGLELGLISKYPLNGWKYSRVYRESKSEVYLHIKCIGFLFEMLLDELIIRDGSRWKYKDGAIEKLLDIHSPLYALYLYCLGFYFKGLAPTDLSFLKKGEIRVIMVKDKNYYAVDGHRNKTGIQYRIRLEQNCLMSNVLIRTMLMFNDGTDYFLPTLKGFKGSNAKKKVNDIYYSHGENLYNWFQRCNELIVKHNVEEGDNITPIDLSAKFYSYRHSYIMSEIQKPNVNLLKIATETGKSLTSLHQYLSYLNDEDLVG